jgi:REP element-mobilizing transposase RayT
VCPAKRRKKVFLPEVEEELKKVCIHIGECYEMIFVEIGSDLDHVHFLIQTIPPRSATNITKITKSITAKKLLAKFPWIKKETLGSNLWTSGYYISTVGAHGNESVISDYVKKQGKKYTQIHRSSTGLFDGYE